MPEMHLRQPGFTYIACGPFTKNKERIQKFKETGDSCIYQNELDKTCLQHDMAYGNFEDITKKTASDKILHDKAFNIAKNRKYYGYQHRPASMVYKFFDKKTFATHARSKTLAMQAAQNKSVGSGIKIENVRPAISRRITSTYY